MRRIGYDGIEEQLTSASARLAIVVTIALLLIFFLLLMSLGAAVAALWYSAACRLHSRAGSLRSSSAAFRFPSAPASDSYNPLGRGGAQRTDHHRRNPGPPPAGAVRDRCRAKVRCGGAGCPNDLACCAAKKPVAKGATVSVTLKTAAGNPDRPVTSCSARNDGPMTCGLESGSRVHRSGRRGTI